MFMFICGVSGILILVDTTTHINVFHTSTRRIPSCEVFSAPAPPDAPRNLVTPAPDTTAHLHFPEQAKSFLIRAGQSKTAQRRASGPLGWQPDWQSCKRAIQPHCPPGRQAGITGCHCEAPQENASTERQNNPHGRTANKQRNRNPD